MDKEQYERLYELMRYGIKAAMRVLDYDTKCTRAVAQKKLADVLKLAERVKEKGTVSEDDIFVASVVPATIDF